MEVISPYKNPRTLIYPSRGLLCLCSQSCIAAPRPTECDGHCFLNKIPFRYLLSSEAPGFRRLTDRSCGVTYSRRHPVLLAGSTLQISEAAIQRGRVRGCRAERKGEAEQKSSAEKHKHRQAQAQTSRAEEVCRGRQAQHTCQHQVQSGNKGVILGKGSTEKKTFSFGHCPNDGGGGLTMPEFFGPLFRSAFLVNKNSLFLQKCQCIELLTVF